MHPTAHEKREWSRMAQSAYRNALTNVGHVYSAAAALSDGAAIHIERFDKLQADYRRWLMWGIFPGNHRDWETS
jgi:hypothetical protein